jgi:radical SAM superfamily enzyme YgiQ (UPF0313 family)
MNILLVNTNTYRFLVPFPIGLSYVATSLKKAGHQVSFFDCMFSKDPAHELGNAIATFKPALVGFSIRNLDTYSRSKPRSFLPPIRDLVSTAKRGKAIAILGGTGFTTLPEAMLEYMNADFGIAGSGETAIVSLADSLQAGKPDWTIPGLVWKDGGVIRTNTPIVSGYAGTSNDWDATSLKNYRKHMFAVGVVATTGCQFQCNYCDSGSVFGRVAMSRDVQEIIEDLKLLRAHGVREFSIIDPCFNTKLSFAKQLLEGIIREGLKVTFCAEIVPATGTYDDELFRLYKRAGGLLILMGGDSLSDAMLQRYHKPCTFDDIFACAHLARSHGITFVQSLLFGGPGENEATLAESLRRIPKIPYAVPAAELGIRIAPNTEVFEIARQEGVVGNEKDLLFPKFYVSKELDCGWAEKAVRRTLGRFRYRGIRMLPVGFKSSLSRLAW